MKISGKVTKGKGRGKKLGFPTANIELAEKIESGVYKGFARVGGKKYKAGIFIDKNSNSLEAHLVGFSGDLYGKEVEIEMGEKIRDVIKFESDEELKGQITDDLRV